MNRRRFFAVFAALPIVGRLPMVRRAAGGAGGLAAASLGALRDHYNARVFKVMEAETYSANPFFAAAERRGLRVSAVDHATGVITLEADG